MSNLVKEIKHKKAIVIGTSAALIITAIAFWTLKSKNVKRKPTGKKQKDMDSKQSQPNDDSTPAKVQEIVSQVNVEEVAEKKQEPVEVPVKVSVETPVNALNDESIKEPTVEKTEEPIKEHIVEPIVESTVKDITEPSVEPTVEDTVESTVEPIQNSIKEIVAEIIETVIEKPTEKTAEKSVEIINKNEHIDESSSIKSQPLSTITNSTNETVIQSPKKIDTQNSVFVDWTKKEDEEFIVVEKEDSNIEADMPKFSSTLTADAPEFIPLSIQQKSGKKPSSKKFLSREQLIEQQRQHHIPKSRARCSHWPHCTNNNCKFYHPYKSCRAGDDCSFGNKCMFVHPKDYNNVALKNNNK